MVATGRVWSRGQRPGIWKAFPQRVRGGPCLKLLGSPRLKGKPPTWVSNLGPKGAAEDGSTPPPLKRHLVLNGKLMGPPLSQQRCLAPRADVEQCCRFFFPAPSRPGKPAGTLGNRPAPPFGLTAAAQAGKILPNHLGSAQTIWIPFPRPGPGRNWMGAFVQDCVFSQPEPTRSFKQSLALKKVEGAGAQAVFPLSSRCPARRRHETSFGKTWLPS